MLALNNGHIAFLYQTTWQKWLLCFMLFMPLLASPEISAKQDKVTLLIRELRNDRGELIVIKEDIRQLLLYFEREAQVNFDVQYYPMARLLNHVNNGYGIAFGLSKNSERLETMQFSEFIYANYVWLITSVNQQFTFDHIDDLKGKTVGIIRGVSFGDEFDRKKNVLFKVEEDPASHVARLKKLAMRRMDVMLFGTRESDARQVEALLRRMQSEDKFQTLDTSETAFTVLRKPLHLDELHFAAATQKHGDIIQRLNVAIERGKKNGEIMRILNPPK
jgi:polar amino acid transport system substrate-binding protein